jgi:hypothetical protein
MRHDCSGKLDATTVISLAALIAALAAAISAGLVGWQVREESRHARLSTSVESVWHLSDQWNSATMLDIRSAAATGLLAGRPTADVEDVLGFFEELVLLTNHGALDEDLAALRFYWPLANYWSASREYVERVQRDQPSAWQDVGALLTRLTATEARRRNRQAAEMLPSKEQVQQFLLDEQGNSECTDDSDAQRTPA